MPIPSGLVTRFLQLLVNRKFADAERELGKIKQKMHNSEWNRGYFRALYGMLIARRSNNEEHTFLSKLDFDDKKGLQNYRKEFRNHVESKLHGDFDRGFFSAWANCMRVLSKLAVNNPKPKNATPKKEDAETIKKDETQAKIERFLKVKA